MIDDDLGRNMPLLNAFLELPFAGAVLLVLYLASVLVFISTSVGRSGAAAEVLAERSAAIDAKMAEFSSAMKSST